MITIKSKAEIEYVKKAASVVSKIHKELKKMIKPGVNGIMLDKMAAKIIKKNNCISNFKGYYGFPNTICVSVNNQLVHGIPNDILFKIGDIVSIDAGAKFHGYNADAAFSMIVGKDISKNFIFTKLLAVTEKSLYKAIKILKPGIRIGEISSTIQKYVEAKGFFLPKNYTGHGIGTSLHEDPIIPNYGNSSSGIKLKEGMVICIEPMVQIGTDKTRTLSDGWSVVSLDGSYSAHFEHTIEITKDGYNILSC